MNERDLVGGFTISKTSENEPKTAGKTALVFKGRYSQQATKEDLLDVCAALGLKIANNVALPVVRRVMRERLVELNERGILPPDEKSGRSA